MVNMTVQGFDLDIFFNEFEEIHMKIKFKSADSLLTIHNEKCPSSQMSVDGGWQSSSSWLSGNVCWRAIQ